MFHLKNLQSLTFNFKRLTKQEMTFGILGSGSWGTAIAKILTDNGHTIYWWNRSEKAIQQIMSRRHKSTLFKCRLFQYCTSCNLTTNPAEVITQSDCIIIAIPSAYTALTLSALDKNIFEGKKVVSAIKGILPEENLLLNDFLKNEF